MYYPLLIVLKESLISGDSVVLSSHDQQPEVLYQCELIQCTTYPTAA